jgi:hypothetical protein
MGTLYNRGEQEDELLAKHGRLDVRSSGTPLPAILSEQAQRADWAFYLLPTLSPTHLVVKLF